MSFEFTIDGAPVRAAGWDIEHHVSGESTASFEISDSVTVRPFSIITVSGDSGEVWTGVARSITRTGTIQKIEAIDRVTMMAWSHSARHFKYGDVVRHRECPEQREMVVRATNESVFTVVLDDVDSSRGEMTAYNSDVLVLVE